MTAPITYLQALEYQEALAAILKRADPAQLGQLRDALGLPAISSPSQKAKSSKLINGAEIWAALQAATRSATSKQDKGTGYWRQLAPDIKAFLARTGQAGAPGCRTEEEQKDRKKPSGAKPKDVFSESERDLILTMAKKHGIGIKAIQQKWIWEGA